MNKSLGTKMLSAATLMWSANALTAQIPNSTGIHKPGVTHKMSDLVPQATIPLGGDPDWMAVTGDGVWVAISSLNRVVRVDALTSQIAARVDVGEPCSGLVVDFGSIWIPGCRDHKLIRADARSGARQAVIEAGPGDSEGGICSGAGSIWIVESKESDLIRIDPSNNKVVAHVRLPPGSMNPVFAKGSIWVSSSSGGKLVRVDPHENKVIGETPVGPLPHFLTVGAGSVWVLNQGDGTVARVDAQTGKRIGLIRAGIAGNGGEIAFAEGAAWATVFGFPITRIASATNEVTGQWVGPGGDSIRLGHGSIWLTDLKGGKLWRIPVPTR